MEKIAIQVVLQNTRRPAPRPKKPVGERLRELVEEVECGGPGADVAWETIIKVFNRLKDAAKRNRLAKTWMGIIYPTIQKYGNHTNKLDLDGDEIYSIFY